MGASVPARIRHVKEAPDDFAGLGSAFQRYDWQMALAILEADLKRESIAVGLLFTAVYIAGNNSDKIFGTVEPLMDPWCLGISAEGIGAVGCMLNFVVTLVVSRLPARPPESVQRLVESVRVPVGASKPEAQFDESDAAADSPQVEKRPNHFRT